MDPVSRRFMWNLISGVGKEKAIILTTHSMEEGDALCNRIGILNRGQLRCLGSPQHLKSKFGSGYNVQIKTSDPKNMESIKEFATANFSGAKLIEYHGQLQTYSLPAEDLSLSRIFKVLETNRSKLLIDEYSVSQSSLEQIFLKMSKSQAVDDTFN
jgi:ABC-type multidrug transport system ATPase subunit